MMPFVEFVSYDVDVARRWTFHSPARTRLTILQCCPRL